jgi:hypothetical protein
MENVLENIFRMTDDLKQFVHKGMLTRLKQTKIENLFSVK